MSGARQLGEMGVMFQRAPFLDLLNRIPQLRTRAFLRFFPCRLGRNACNPQAVMGQQTVPNAEDVK